MPSHRSAFLRALRRASSVFASLTLATAAVAAHATPTDFPNKALRLVVPYPAGGTADIIARELAQRLSTEWGQPVVVDNRAGAGTVIGARHVAASTGDGYTLFIGTSTSHAINPALNSTIGYDPVKDFTALAAVGEVPYVVVTHPSKNVRTLRELIAHAKAQPGGAVLSYSSAGIGSSNHLGGVLLSQLAGVSLNHIPYKGSAPALNDVLAGQVDFMFDLVTTSLAHVRQGKLVALATTAQQRADVLPQVPTSSEAGLPELQVTAWFGIFAPSGVAEPVRAALVAGLTKVLGAPDAQEKFRSLGLTLMPQRGETFAQFVEQDWGHWRAVAQSSSIKLGE